MYYKSFYDSPIGGLTLVSDGENLVGLWLEGQKYYESTLAKECPVLCVEDLAMLPVKDKSFYAGYQVLSATKNWLDRYFAEERPEI